MSAAISSFAVAFRTALALHIMRQEKGKLRRLRRRSPALLRHHSHNTPTASIQWGRLAAIEALWTREEPAVVCNLLAQNRSSDSIVVFEERARRDQARADSGGEPYPDGEEPRSRCACAQRFLHLTLNAGVRSITPVVPSSIDSSLASAAQNQKGATRRTIGSKSVGLTFGPANTGGYRSTLSSRDRCLGVLYPGVDFPC
jgi:hypothetical protein